MVSSLTLGILTGLSNFLVLVFNAGFSMADELAEPNPGVFSVHGQVMILVWGLTFIAAGVSDAGPAVWAVFALEKMCYVVIWGMWMNSNPDALSKLLALHASAQEESGNMSVLLAPTFHLIYGPIAVVFVILFLTKALEGKRTPTKLRRD
uniref:Uncharacterized protein n=1 Tax=Proboscia inermis TaxID=420281 RepID=A0A6T8KVS3_9STRA|mmetsp:Transcript_35306/g.35511  ORF Transcript_35306/g.35511 Transcript_35306/m.35511 type:complete len:150 (+) Transcript_35306:226-675(+)|eukprot:CAMPEP_0171293684 /NCGR_PEP_ID=MMETSP0816-20121228/2012_1 /TAXON_ID=420281 /ORGANISM="Proboscia inermis, Strain CCAP1064/1" /LENGTH=149 /DNA_ID=CAMNT_0011764815 /DNA_START=187 /DNA_END=636 /DNA_ORIENTATION=+